MTLNTLITGQCLVFQNSSNKTQALKSWPKDFPSPGQCSFWKNKVDNAILIIIIVLYGWTDRGSKKWKRGRFLFYKTQEVERDTISRLNHLQDQVGREQLFLRVQEEARGEAGLREGTGLEEIPVWEKAATNARWAEKALDAASAILQVTGGKIGVFGTFFSRPAVNGQVIKRKSYQSVELVFIDPEDKSVQIIPADKADDFFRDVYDTVHFWDVEMLKDSQALRRLKLSVRFIPQCIKYKQVDFQPKI